MSERDVATVARLHSDAFPRFFLTELGVPALRALYSGFLTEGIAMVAERDGAVVGVVAGTARPAGFYRRVLLRRWWQFALALTPRVLRRPSLASRLLWRGTKPAAPANEAALLSLAVLPAEQRNGVGAALVRDFVAGVRGTGATSVSLTTDAADNDRVTTFYERLGFRRRSTFTTPENRTMHEYVIDL